MEREDVLVVQQVFVYVRSDQAHQHSVDDEGVALFLRPFWKGRRGLFQSVSVCSVVGYSPFR